MTDGNDLLGLKIYEGLTIDVEHIMTVFVETECVRFEEFSRIWQEMNFSLIYSGIKSMEQKKEFIQEAFSLAAMYLSPPFDFQKRVGGLYLIYALYYTQRHQPRLKVRMTAAQWKQLLLMEEELKKQGHLDACYILMKLRAVKAFCFVQTTRPLIYNKMSNDEIQDKWLAENQREIEEAFPEDLLRRLHNTHLQYQMTKEQLGLFDDVNANHVKTSVAEWIARRLQNPDIDDDSDDELEKKQLKERGQRVAEIKQKSYEFSQAIESTQMFGNISYSEEDEEGRTLSAKSGLPRGRPRGRVTKVKMEATMEMVMPRLKNYTLSDSEEEEREKSPPPTPKKADTRTSDNTRNSSKDKAMKGFKSKANKQQAQSKEEREKSPPPTPKKPDTGTSDNTRNSSKGKAMKGFKSKDNKQQAQSKEEREKGPPPTPKKLDTGKSDNTRKSSKGKGKKGFKSKENKQQAQSKGTEKDKESQKESDLHLPLKKRKTSLN